VIEPWERDWSGLADWQALPRLVPTIPALLAHTSAAHPNRDVLVLDDRRMTYAELDRRSARFARQLLGAGIGRGARVGIMLPNDESFLVSWLGAARVGAVAITLPSLAKAGEIARIADHAGLDVLVAMRRYLHHDYAVRLAEAFPDLAGPRSAQRDRHEWIWLWCEPADGCPGWARRIGPDAAGSASSEALAAAEGAVGADDPAGVIYTSGSTAEPKGVIHSHGNFVRQALKLAAAFGYAPGERTYASMPFFWVGGLVTTALCMMAAGGTILASRRTGSALLDFIEAQETTAVVTWPHILRSLADDPSFAGRRWSAMRNGLFYDALPPERRPADPSLMATPIGMTETCGPYTVIDRFIGEEQRGSVGVLMPGVEARLVDPDDGALIGEWREGETRHADSLGRLGVLHLRSDVMMLGMVGRDPGEVFAPGGWYATGDLVTLRDGHLHYHGRADDLIKAHGANVSPREVEGVIAGIAGVAAAHAVGVPDARRGTVVGAVVVPQPGAELDAAVVRETCARALASYKVPRLVLIRAAADLPLLASSKIDRRALAGLLQAASVAEKTREERNA
jgi:acyl-CoA synthetase (AMP-forming)/AMP-acid ligase II